MKPCLRALASVALMLVLLSGCGGVRSAPYTLGRYRTATEHELFARVLHALLVREYAIDGADERLGIIEVRSHWRRGRAHATFVVQLVRPGWVVIRLRDEQGREAHDVHRALAEEHDVLALSVRHLLENPVGER